VTSVHRRLALVVAPFALATVVGLIVLWPPVSHVRAGGELGAPADLVNGTVKTVNLHRCDQALCADVHIRLTSGPDRGHQTTLADFQFGAGIAELHAGDRVVLGRTVDPTDEHVDYYFADFQRRLPLQFLALLFTVVVVVIARWRGVAALAGLFVTWLVLVRFIIPAVLHGESPVAVAVVGGAAILFVVLYVAHGLSVRTTTALIGTLASLALTGGLAAAFVAASHITGFSSDEATYLQSITTNVSLSGLILGGIVIGSLGVLNDITVTQTSSVWEIHEADPTRSTRALYRSGMRVGRDHIASVVYTLVLAYAGASLPLLILFTVAGQPLAHVVTSEVVAEEIVRTLVGSIGLVAAVPITTWLAALVVHSTGTSRRVHAARRILGRGPVPAADLD
jgi:uncharacterized membrane protein